MGGKSQESTFILTGSQLFWSPPLPKTREDCEKQQRTLTLMTVLKEWRLNFSPKRYSEQKGAAWQRRDKNRTVTRLHLTAISGSTMERDPRRVSICKGERDQNRVAF